VTSLVILRKLPVDVASKFTLKLQVVFAPSNAADRLTTPDPAVAVMVPPPHAPDNPLGVATTSPAGSVSVKPIPGRLNTFGLVIVNVRGVV